MSASLVGQKLGKYEITALLGQGGMATVYKGYQRDVDRSVAIKVLPPHPGQNSQFIERFRLEARTIARLQHPHILPLYDYGDENDVLYLVMAYAEGGSVSDRIRRGPMALSEIQNIFQQVAEALDYAHRQNVIHRDIKPDNILLDREGHVLLSDFGIVKIIEESEKTLSLTATGGLVGTPSYMSPEQAQGLPVTDRTDIYSLGIVVYEMLAGKQPFSAETPMQVVLKHITAPVPPLHEFNGKLPPQLDGVLQRALEKEPTQRYASAQTFYEDFKRVIEGEAPLTPSKVNLPALTSAANTALSPNIASSQPTMIAQPAWNPLVLLGGFAIIALLIVAVVALMLNFNRQPAAAPTAVPVVLEATVPAASLPTPNSSVPNFGTVTYSTRQTPGDTVNIQVKGLTAPASGSSYRVWLYNTGTEESLKVGDLNLDALGNGQLSVTSSGMLPVLYNAILITPESGDSATPSGKTAYSGLVPNQMMSALREILITSPDGLAAPDSATTADASQPEATADPAATSSLLAGALDEATIAEKHAGLAAQAVSVGSLHSHNEHTINILRGTYVDYNGDGQGQNPGHGDGIAYFTDRIQAKLNAIVAASSSDHLVQSQVDLIGVCLVNVTTWVNQVVALETQMLSANSLDAVHQQQSDSTALTAAIINGVDLNKNGQVEPFEGECGLEQIDDFGISVANMVIVSGSLPQGE
ncbi:MAG: protein kinase [Chloroflexi bacterium]|nr:protein kinase [Chloroflexota bacterium]